MADESFLQSTRVTRRQFLGVLGGGALGAGLSRPILAGPIGSTLPIAPPLPVVHHSPWPVFRLTRPADQLCLEVELVNLRLIAEEGAGARPWQAHIDSHHDQGYIVLRFPGQHYAEQALWDRGPQTPSRAAAQTEDEQRKAAEKDPPVPVTYQLWRSELDWSGPANHLGNHNDDLAFLRFAPWRVPPSTLTPSEAERQTARERELERLQRSRWYFPQRDEALNVSRDGFKPWELSSWPDTYVKGRPQHPAWTTGDAGMWVSGGSQVVFAVPQWRTPFPCDLESLLRLCTQLDLAVPPQLDPEFDRVAGDGQEKPEPPLPKVQAGVSPADRPPATAIEFPTLLYLSPYENARWRLRPTVAGSPSELWALELEPSREQTLPPGTAREQRAAGHLFAFARRPVEEAVWPQDILDAPSLPPEDPRHHDKYSPYEAPKVGLAEGTQRAVVKQHREDNGDTRAQYFALTPMGISADLHYRPALEPDGDQPEREKRPGDAQPTEEEKRAALAATPLLRHRARRQEDEDLGLLSEWISQADLGRNYATNEAFAGWWMPWGFKAESIILETREPTLDPWLEFTHGGARQRRRDLLLEAGWNIPAPKFTDLEEHEAHLVARLVARKFARVKPRLPGKPLIRIFGEAESEDFMNSAARAAREAGIYSIEILRDRTPVLANQYCSVPESDFERTMEQGLDLRVAGGTGRDFGREIFLPRVRDFVRKADGNWEGRLVPYKFPMRVVYHHRAAEEVEMPMLFVPTPSLGKRLYDRLPEELRTFQTRSKISFVSPSSPATLNPLNLGPAEALQTGAKATWSEILPSSAKALVQGDALGKAGSLGVVADGLNAFIEGPAGVIQRLLTSTLTGKPEYAVPRLDAALQALLPDPQQSAADLARQWRDLTAPLAVILAELTHAEEEAEEVVRSVRRFLAWGTEEVTSVDHLIAAARLEHFWQIPEGVSVAWADQVAASLVALQSAATLAEEASAAEVSRIVAFLQGISASVDKLKVAARSLATGLPAEVDRLQQEYGRALRELLVQWAARLAGAWSRHAWDPVFHAMACFFDAGRVQQQLVLTGTFKKRLQLRLLRWEGEGRLVLKLTERDLELTVREVVLKPTQEWKDLQSSMQQWLERIATAAAENPQVLERLLRGLEASLEGERGLRQRLHFLIEDLAAKGYAAVQKELGVVIRDAHTLMAQVLTHAQEGRQRFERFVAQVESAPELVAATRELLVGKLSDWQRTTRTELQKLPAVAEAVHLQESIQSLLVTANPAQLRQKLEDLVDVTGRRLLGVLQGQLDELYQGAALRLEKLQALAQQGEEDIARAAAKGEEALEELERLFTLAEKVPGEFRDTVERYLEVRRTEIVKALSDLALSSPADRWRDKVLQLLSVTPRERLHSWRLAQGAVRLAEDLLQVLPKARAEAVLEVGRVRQKLLAEITRQAAVGHESYAQAAVSLQNVAEALGGEWKRRGDALVAWLPALKDLPRVLDAAGYLLTLLLDLRRLGSEQAEQALQSIFAGLAKSQLLEKLASEFPLVMEKMAALRSLVGEVEGIQEAIGKLGTEQQAAAQLLWEDIKGRAGTLATGACADLKERAFLVEGAAFQLTKRALASLPIPAMVREFQDQSQKALLQGSQLVFGVGQLGEGIASQLAFPKLAAFHVEVPGLETTQIVSFTQEYLEKGLRNFEQAQGAVYGRLHAAAASVVQNAGLIEARQQIQELSRELGALADGVKEKFENLRAQGQQFVEDLKGKAQQEVDAKVAEIKATATEAFRQNVADLLPPEMGKILGAFKPSDLLAAITSPSSIPQLVASRLPDRREESRTWSILAQEKNLGFVKFFPDKKCLFRLDARAVIYYPQPGRELLPPSYTVRGQLGVFDITVADMLILHFRSLSFSSENGHQQCVPKLGKADLADVTQIVEFQGALRFLEDIRNTLGSFMSGDSPFRLQIKDDYIFATLVFAIPQLGFGAVSITGLTFRTSLGLPLGKGALIFRFALSDRIETFRVFGQRLCRRRVLRAGDVHRPQSLGP